MCFVIQVVHCDLAARNILIAEGFLLKIGDFGMARCMAPDWANQKSDPWLVVYLPL